MTEINVPPDPRLQPLAGEGMGAVSAALDQHRQDRFEVVVGEFLELVVGAVLHRMGNEHQRRVDTQRFRLGGGTFDKLGGGDADRWNAASFEICHVMRTARNAGPSVGQSFDDEVDFGGDLLPQRQRRHARVGRLGVVLDGDAAFGDPLAETVQKHVAARFCDVENTNRQPVELLRPRQAHPNRRTSFRGWVEKDGQFLTSLVTGRLLREPPADQPAMIPENMPASPPARTIIIPPGRNLLTVLPASVAGPPSAMPLAPATRSSPGISHSRYSSSLTRAFDQPAFLKVR